MLHLIENTILPLIISFKYIAIFGMTMLAASILPIPPGTLIIASSALSYNGYFKLGFVILAAILGKVVGNSISYWLSHHFGYKVFSKIGLKKVIDSERFKRVSRKVKANPGWILFFSRFEISLNLILNILSGMGKIKYSKFFLITTLGEISQILIYSTLGYFFGSNWQKLSKILSGGLLGIIVILIIIYFIYRYYKIIKNRKNKTPLGV